MTWAWDALRGTVSSLVAPAVLLAAALVVAVGGSGADALSSLSQLTKGPDIPPTPVEMVSRDAPVGADVGQLDGRLVALAGARAGQRSAAAGSRQSNSGGGSAPSSAGGAGGASTPSSASGPAGDTSGGSGSGRGSAPSASAPSKPPSSSSPPAPARPNPVGEVLDQTQQLTDPLLKPVKPVTDQVLGGLGR